MDQKQIICKENLKRDRPTVDWSICKQTQEEIMWKNEGNKKKHKNNIIYIDYNLVRSMKNNKNWVSCLYEGCVGSSKVLSCCQCYLHNTFISVCNFYKMSSIHDSFKNRHTHVRFIIIDNYLSNFRHGKQLKCLQPFWHTFTCLKINLNTYGKPY